MADPLSVAGLAAGLVSLGLQVCGGVITYLDALDCREQDLVSLRQYHSSVHQTLQVVEASLGQLQQAHQGAADAARSCLDACHTELKGLETLLAELTSGTQPAGSGLRRRDKFKQEGKKLLYPFSRPKLEQLEARLQNANKALQLALQALGLSVSYSRSEQLSRIESISHSMSANLLVVQSDIQAMNTPLTNVNTRVNSLEHLVTQLLAHNPALTSKVITTRPPRRPRAPKDHARHAHPAPTQTDTAAPPGDLAATTALCGDKFQSLMSSLVGGVRACVCRRSRILRRRNFSMGPVGFSLEIAAHEHLPECPISQIVGPDQTRTVGLKYTGFRRLLGSAVELSFAMKSGAGGWAISPNLTYYPTVAQCTAPAFQTVMLLHSYLGFIRAAHKRPSIPDWEKLVALACGKILRRFQSGQASPLAVNDANQSLGHVVARCISAALELGEGDLIQPLIELLRCLIMHKVPVHLYDMCGVSPLCALVSSYYGTTSLHVAASELIIRSSPELAPACLSKAPPPAVSLAHRGNHNPILSTVRFLGHSPQVAEAYGCGPLSLAVLANDTTPVAFLLKYHPSTLDERNLLGQSPLHLAVVNPACLRLLLSAVGEKQLNALDHSGTTAVEVAVLQSSSICKKKKKKEEEETVETEDTGTTKGTGKPKDASKPKDTGKTKDAGIAKDAGKTKDASKRPDKNRCRRCRCAESATLLIKANCAIPVTNGLQALLTSASYRCKLKYMRAIRDRREKLKKLAMAFLTAEELKRLGVSAENVLDSPALQVTRLLEQRGIEVPDALRTPETPTRRPLRSVYHGLDMLDDSELFFRLGFAVDLRFEDYAVLAGCRNLSQFHLRWLADRGVDILGQRLRSFEGGGALVTAHFTFGTVGLEIARANFRPQAIIVTVMWVTEFRDKFLSTGILETADGCRCECWPGGCTPVAFTLKAMVAQCTESKCRDLYVRGEPTVNNFTLGNAFMFYFSFISQLFEATSRRGALRFILFEALGIHHTCCQLFRGRVRKWNPNSCSNNVWDSDDDEDICCYGGDGDVGATEYELGLLDELVEECEGELNTILDEKELSNRMSNLITFWVRVATTGLAKRQKLLEGNALEEDEKRKAEEIGVVWARPAGPRRPSPNPYPLCRDEFWFCELDMIGGNHQRCWCSSATPGAWLPRRC